MPPSFRVLALIVPVTTLVACGDEPGSPAAPSPTTASVSVTVASPVRMGQTAQATGNEMRSGGQTQAITSGWLSDAPNVATVSGSGLVTGIANGRATIYVVSGGVQGQQVVRVVPDYQGRWSGRLRVTSCTETGLFGNLDFCDEFPSGTVLGYSLTLSQSGEQATATLSYGAQLSFPAATSPIREDGSVAYSTSGSMTDSGVTITVGPSVTLNSTRVGDLSGTGTDTWRVAGLSGEGRLAYDVVGTTRSSTTTSSRDGDAFGSALRRLSHPQR